MSTREERPTVTTAKANAVHAKDTYNLYSSVNDAMSEMDESNGGIPVHDEWITDPVTGEATQKHYVKRFKQMARDYDILDNALKTAELLDPTNAGIPALRKEIDAIIKAKQELIDTQFNDDTQSIFGQDATKVPDPITKNTPPPKLKKEEIKVKPVKISKGLKQELETLAEKSTVIKDFLKTNTKIINSKNKRFSFRPHADLVTLGAESDISGKARKDLTTSEMTELVEHEIIHSYTYAYLAKELIKSEETMNSAVLYAKKSLEKLRSLQAKDPQEFMKTADKYQALTNTKGFKYDDGTALERIDYILTRPTELEQLSEFVSIMEAEPETRSTIGMIFSDGRSNAGLYSKIKDIITYIKSFLIPNKPLAIVYAKPLRDSLQYIVKEGKAYKFDNYKEAIKVQKKAITNKLGAGESNTFTKAERFINNRTTNLNDAVYSMLLGKIETGVESLSNSTHKLLKEKFPVYQDVTDKINGIYGNSTALQQLLQFMHISKLNDKQKKNMVQSVTSEIHHNRNTRDNDIMTKIDDLTKDFTEDQHTDLYNFINKATLSDYFLYGYKNTSKASMTDRIIELDESMSELEKGFIDHFTSLYTDNKVLNSSYGYNLDAHYSAEGQKAKDMKELIALKGLEKLGLDKFEALQENIDLFDIIKDNAIALAMIHKDIGDGINMRSDVKGSLVGEYYEKQLQKKVITEAELDKFSYEEGSGWRVIVEPVDGKVGIVVRTIDDGFYLEGSGIDLGTTSNDLLISPILAETLDLEANNIIKLNDGSYKKILSHDEKTDMGIIRKPGHSLIHTTSHMIAAQEAGILRKEMLKKDIRIEIDTNDSSNVAILQTLIKDKDIDHHWFIKLGKDAKYINLPADIKAKYKPIDVKLSNIHGFKNEISLVRKDMAYWLTGDSKQFFNNNPKIQKASKVAKQLISGAKIGMAVANPTKLMKDTASNTAFLTAMGVPLSMQLSEGKSIMAEMDTLGQLRTQIAKIRVKQVAYPNDKNLQTKYNKLLAMLEAHTLNGVVKRGFMNSLSSDIYNNNIDSLKGMQADVNTGLKYLLNKKDGTPNIINKYISDIANVTGDGTEVLRYIGNIVGKAESTAEMGKMLDAAANRISKIKNNEDSVAYLNNFILTPNSEIVKAGVWYNDAIDTVAKETYYRYLTQNKKMDPVKAEVLVIESFPDYKENMPMAMKILSDYGILMFPSYWTRIHVPAYRMVTKRTINVGLELELSNLTNTHLESILDATLPVRLDSNMDIVHSPLDIVGIDSIFPTQLFR